jgi:hypothetical protein
MDTAQKLTELSNVLMEVKEKLTSEEWKEINDKMMEVHNDKNDKDLYLVQYIELSFVPIPKALNVGDSRPHHAIMVNPKNCKGIFTLDEMLDASMLRCGMPIWLNFGGMMSDNYAFTIPSLDIHMQCSQYCMFDADETIGGGENEVCDRWVQIPKYIYLSHIKL